MFQESVRKRMGLTLIRSKNPYRAFQKSVQEIKIRPKNPYRFVPNIRTGFCFPRIIFPIDQL